MASVDVPRSSRDTPQPVGVLPALALFAFALFFLYAFRPVELSDNSIGYIGRVLEGDVFYAPHLLHAAIILCFHTILSALTTCDVACAGMTHSMLWAAVTIASVYLVARATLGTAGGAILTALMVLVAHGFWVFATQLEVYVPSVGAVAAATAVLFTSRSPALSTPRLIAVSLLWFIATMYHMANVFLFIPLCVYFYSAQGLRGWRQLALISALAGGLVLAAYLMVYALEGEAWSLTAFLGWVFALTNVPMTDWGLLSNWHPRWLLSAGWRQIMALTLLPEYLTADQRPLWVVGALVAVVTLSWNALQVVRPAGPTGAPRGARLYFLALFGTNFLFFGWWQPFVHKFYIPSSIPLMMLMAMGVRDLYLGVRTIAWRHAVVGASAALVGVLFVFNLSSVLELRRSLGPDHAEAAVLDKLAPPGCVIYSVGHHLNPLHVYFGRKDTVSIRTLLSEFYLFATGEGVPPSERRAVTPAEECALIPLGFLSRWYYGYRADDYLGMARWPEYVAYFFDANEDPATGGITHSAFELVAEGDGPPHVLVDRKRRMAAGSAAQLAGTLQDEVERALQRYAAEWPTRHDHPPNLAFVPRVKVEIGRLRRNIFGYAFGEWGRRVGQDGEESAR